MDSMYIAQRKAESKVLVSHSVVAKGQYETLTVLHPNFKENHGSQSQVVSAGVRAGVFTMSGSPQGTRTRQSTST